MADLGEVCVIGGGIGGIATAKVFLADGFDVTLYEKSRELGGTWSSNRRYINLQHQLPTGFAELIDKPWGDGYADGEQLQTYLYEYINEFGIDDCIELGIEVQNIEQSASKWKVTTRDATDRTEPEVAHLFDYVAVCTGAHHIPRIPELSGRDEFEGDIYHSCEVSNPEMLRDNDVVVVGMGKSAQDLCTESARLSATTTMVFRKANWMIPKKMWGIIPLEYLFYTRFGEAFLPEYYNEETWRWLDRTPQRIKTQVGRLFEHGVIKGNRYDEAPDDIVPETSLLDTGHASTAPDGFIQYILDGEITPEKATIKRIENDGVVLDNEQHVPADTIILATGYRDEHPLIDDDIDLKTDDGNFHLYRGIVPPETDGLGIIGRRELFNNFLSMHLSAHWLSDYFRGELIDTPTTEAMHDSIRRRNEWMETLMPNNKGYDYGGYHYHSFDELLIDMGVSTNRRNNVLAEWFGLNARGKRYDGLQNERRDRSPSKARETSQIPVREGAYLSFGLLVLALAWRTVKRK